MIFLKTDDEIELLRKSNLLVGQTLAEIAKAVKPGVTTGELDKIADEFIRDHGAVPTFKGFPYPYGSPFPASICTSVNEQVVHGIPGNVVLKDGDIVSVDCGTYMNGFCGDSAYTFCVGEVAEDVRQLLKVTKEALYIGIETAYGRRGYGPMLKQGLCIAIEPMVTLGDRHVVMERDGWSVRTKDRKCAAHFEHTIAVTAGKADILSSFDFIEEVILSSFDFIEEVLGDNAI